MTTDTDPAFDVQVERDSATGVREWLNQRRQELPAWTASLLLHLVFVVSIPKLGPTPALVNHDEAPLYEAVLANPTDWNNDAEAGRGNTGTTTGAHLLQATFATTSPKPTESKTAGQQDQHKIDPSSSGKNAKRGRPRESNRALAKLDAEIEYIENRLTKLTAKISRETKPQAQDGDSNSLRDEQSEGSNQHVGRDAKTPQAMGSGQGSEAPDGSDQRAVAGGRGNHGDRALGEGSRTRSPPLPLITYAGDNRGNVWVWRRRRQELYRQQKERELRERAALMAGLERAKVAGEIAVLTDDLKLLERRREQLVAEANGSLESTDKPGDIVLIDHQSRGFYNDALGNRLDARQWNLALSAGQYYTKTETPDLSAIKDVLGEWLGTGAPAGRWMLLAPVPDEWASRQETAVVYELQNNSGDTLELLGTFSVRDAGMFVWVDGKFRFGSGYGAGRFKLTRASLGELSPGRHYVQILRESDAEAPRMHVRLVGRKLTR